MSLTLYPQPHLLLNLNPIGLTAIGPLHLEDSRTSQIKPTLN